MPEIENGSGWERENHNSLNRRSAIKAFSAASIAALGGISIPVLGEEKPIPAAKRLSYIVYETVKDLKQDGGLKAGNFARTLGFYEVGDGGGAEYVIANAKPQETSGSIILSNGLYCTLINAQSVNYKMFGAVGDGQNDDGLQIKEAHDYANRLDIPVINTHGEFWIKQTKLIEILTNVHWGHTIFHIDEKFNSLNENIFIVSGREKALTLDFDAATKTKLLAQIRPGATIIPELAPYKNYLMVVTDTNDRIGVRSGEVYAGRSTKPREEFFFVEEHGRIIGDLAWGFKDYTKIMAYPGSNSYLIIDGGTFYFSGESSNIGGGSYFSMGITINRSRTVIRNQWVGLEKGKQDLAMAPRKGFYTFSYVYDVLLENATLIPWEKDRPGTGNDVPNGTYGIGGSYALNATFRNVTAEGSPIHWGVFGTNLFKNFRVEQCMLNRIDVHFYCWNLYIKDSKVGTNGITITGGGDLYIENTTCRSNSFVSFRRDYGGKWDGDIRIRNCKHVPAGMGESALLTMAADDIDYKYPIGYGRTVKVENMVVDFSTVPNSKGISWLMRLSPFSKAAYGGRVFFPSHLEFKNIVVEGREQGMRLLNIPDPQNFQLSKTGSYDGNQLMANCKMIFEDIHLEKLPPADPQSTEQTHLVLRRPANVGSNDAHSLYPEIRVSRCNEFAAHLGGNVVDMSIENCKINRFTGADSGFLKGGIAFSSCKFEASVTSSKKPYYNIGAELGTTLSNCVIYAPRVDDTPRPELVDHVGFVRVNKAVYYNQLNTRLGNDILNYQKNHDIKLNERFISMLKAHHELESNDV